MNLNNPNNFLTNDIQNTEIEPDINIINYLKNSKNNNNANYEKALNIFNQNNIDINEQNECSIHYYLEPNYTKEFYDNYDANNVINNPINYYFASFDANERGLEKSQLKTLFNVLKHYQQTKNNYVAINGGPGVGKSTIANYIISNLLLQDLGKEKDLKPKTILLTGKTIQSVKNISEITTINPPKEHQWISNNKYNDEINYLFYKLDIDYRQLNELNEIGTNQCLILNDKTITTNESFLKCITASFIDNFKNYFNLMNVQWNQIDWYLWNKINKNISIIQSFNNLIAKRLNNDLTIFNDKCYKLNDIIHWWSNIDIKTTYESLNDLIVKIQDIDIFQNSYELNKIKSIKKKIQNKFFQLFLPKKKVYNRILKLVQQKTNLLFNELKGQIQNISNSFNNIQQNNHKLELNFQFLNNQNILNTNDINQLLLLLDEIVINFNNIQKELDKKIRLENSFLWRHYQEWQFIKKLYQIKNKTKNNNIVFKWEDLRIIKPVISSNIQKISMTKIKEKLKIEKFDYVIVDEASQMPVIYAVYLELIATNMIVLGDDKQIPAINDKDKHEFIQSLEQQLMINNRIQYQSLLDYVNQKTTLISELTKNESYSYKQKGLYLLEHFRCPEQIFKLFNKHFYNNTLHFMNTNDSTCSISNKFGKYTTCNDTSLIYLTYQFDENYLKGIQKWDNDSIKEHINIKEIEIGFNFIIDNFFTIKEHVIQQKNDEKSLEKLANNICFISLHTNQNEIVEDLIKYLTTNESKYFNNIDYHDLYIRIKSRIDNKFKIETKNDFLNVLAKIKTGTIDSLQGIGCEFVIFSLIKSKNSDLENGSNRMNVLYSRVKKHFIQIMANDYWNGCTKLDNVIKARKEIELNKVDNGYSKVLIDIDKIDDLNIKNINKPIYKNSTNQISIIGARGEKIFNSVLKDPNFKQLIANKIKKHSNNAIKIKNDYHFTWCNENNESFKTYDFVIDNNLYIDVKSTIKTSSNSVFMSQGELDFGLDNPQKYMIAKVNDVGNYNLNFKNKSSLYFILKNINFYLLIDEKKLICYSNKQNPLIQEINIR